MGNITWENVIQDEQTITNGIKTIGFKDLGKVIPNVGEMVGYNGILKGDSVMYDGERYTVVMVSRMGDFGLSKTGKLPYIIRVVPKKVTRV
jgi:hypothetical protein